MSKKIRDLQDFLALLDDVKGPSASGNYVARCPAHDDGTPSLTVCAKESPRMESNVYISIVRPSVAARNRSSTPWD